MSSHARKLLPAEVLAHPSIASLVAAATPTGTVSPEDVRRASDDAGVEPRHLKALLVHLSGLGISVQVDASSSRAVAATGTGKRAATTSTAKKAPAKKAAAKTAAKTADAKAPAKKAAAKKTTATKAAAASAAPANGRR